VIAKTKLSTTTFSQVAADWLDTLPKVIQDNGREYPASTLQAYARSVKRAAEIIGSAPLESINNETIRDLIAAMRADGYSPASIRRDLTVVKLVCESLTNNGTPLYPLQINRKFVRIPRIVADEQNAPCATRQDIERALQHPELAGPIAIAAGAGLRVSEILSLRGGDCPNADCWDASESAIHIRITCKTKSARRSIPLPVELHDFLQRLTVDKSQGDLLFTLSRNRLYNLLSSRDLPPMHAFRRFFTTVRDEAGINPGALKRLLGHSKGSDITARYSRATENLDFLRDEMERCPLGFALPEAAAPKRAERRETAVQVSA
jgi:integrase